MALEQFELELVERIKATTNTLHLVFRRLDGKRLDFIAGQFITLLLTNAQGELKRRSYSIASYPGEDQLAIAISFISGGIASEQLFNLKLGDQLKAMGPAGRLILHDEQVKRYILVGTGTGVAPYRAMLPEIAARMSHDPEFCVEVILGVQYRTDLLYGDDFIAFAKVYPRFKFTAQYSRESEVGLAEFERKGYVQHSFSNLNLNAQTDIIYLCGNPNMIDEAVKALTEQYGFATASVRREKYISSN